ncbi:MAG: cell envelope integrity protein CreD [Pseudomonadota bacterium]
MQKSLFLKVLIILGLTVLIFILMAVISNTIEERSEYRQQAVHSIANDSVREQTITGPILIIPYTDEYEETLEVEGKKEVVTRNVQREHLVFPSDYTVEGSVDTDRRYRGIHQVLVYSGHHHLHGNFVLPVEADLARAGKTSRLTIQRARVALGIEDVRGIRDITKLDWDGSEFEFQQGTAMKSIVSGLHASVPGLTLQQPATARFSLKLGLDGIERQHFVPVGKSNVVTLKSTWPHPQFGGRFLPSPRDRTIGDDGFKATWKISSLSTNAQQQLRNLEALGAPQEFAGPVSTTAATPDDVTARARGPQVDRFSVGFVEPVNVYSLADRATKYGLLFVILTFGAFFIFEMLKRLPIHPIQYLLVGLALVVFFLLLVSLSEHIAFGVAYLSASLACIALISFYLSHVLRDWRRGVGFGLGLTLLYSALYGLLISESNALVMGSILLFAILAAVMVATRKIDWYQVGAVEVRPQAA